MSSASIQSSGRIYSFDWLRIIAFAIVVLIHCVQMFGELYNAQFGLKLNDGAAYFVSFITYWCMALFFLLAGASTWLAIRRKTPQQFIQERVRRLLIPFLLGYALMVPFQTYFEMTSNGQYSGTLIEFYPFFLGNVLFNGKLIWLVSSIHHLWFLLYLFVFSLVALPLCLYLRSERGLAWIERLAAICERPGGLLVPTLPIIAVLVGLRAIFPVYCSVADALCWILFYIDGYILFASPRLRQALQQQGKLALGLGMVGLAAILILGRMGLLHAWMYTPDYSVACLLFQTLVGLTLWSWLIVTLTVGDKYLNRNSSFLKYGSAASFSWYLLHFPIVIFVAYSLLPLHLYALAAFLLVSSSSFAITFVLADLPLRTSITLAQLKTRLHTIATHWFSEQPTADLSTTPLEHTITGHLNTRPLIG
ncbi:MAG TPA: acyltransferase family protein [Ktedonosporobacter sp.]|nr:acyltransferase family protein [Ktedonosporobacter sp.]